MKLLACLLVLVAVLAAPATASAPTLKTLQRQITALRLQVVTQQRAMAQMATAETQQNNRITCDYAVGSDNLNLVWHTLNLLAQYNGFPPQPDFPRYDDRGACSALGVTRSR